MKDKILSWNFKAIARRYIILALCVALVGGITSGLLLRTQIDEALTLVSLDEWQDRRSDDWQETDGKHDREHGHDEWDEQFLRRMTPPSAAAMIFLGMMAVSAGLMAAAYWLLVSAWLYQAAYRSAMNPLLWALAGLAGNLAAVMLFLLVRSFVRVRCQECGHWQEKTPYCRHCGTALEKKCPSCGVPVKAGDSFCGHCGEKFSDAEAKDV